MSLPTAGSSAPPIRCLIRSGSLFRLSLWKGFLSVAARSVRGSTDRLSCLPYRNGVWTVTSGTDRIYLLIWVQECSYIDDVRCTSPSPVRTTEGFELPSLGLAVAEQSLTITSRPLKPTGKVYTVIPLERSVAGEAVATMSTVTPNAKECSYPRATHSCSYRGTPNQTLRVKIGVSG
ncbi:hypothetical protein BDN67DRAFT_184907 [Paxillus ammoniavirescens]|nr:hypothetical protein BDN67DRAFT_184907 [Paxillus ammoniavirescens]